MGKPRFRWQDRTDDLFTHRIGDVLRHGIRVAGRTYRWDVVRFLDVSTGGRTVVSGCTRVLCFAKRPVNYPWINGWFPGVWGGACFFMICDQDRGITLVPT